MEETRLYEKKTSSRIKILETTNDGHLVCNPDFPDDKYVIPFDVFESTYKEVVKMRGETIASPHTPPEETRAIVLDALESFGRPAFTFFLDAIMQDKRMLNQVADMMFMMARPKMKGFPPEVIQKVGKLKGFERMVEFILMIAPLYLEQMPIEKLEEGLKQALPFCERIVQSGVGVNAFSD